MKLLTISSAIITSLTISANATTSFKFSDFVASSFATAANNGSSSGNNGLYWGLVIDGGDGTLDTTYQGGFTFSNNFSASNLIGTSSSSDDKLFISSQQTFTFFGNAGTMTTLDNVNVNGLNGNKFALIWFDSNDIPSVGTVDNGDHYGFFTHSSFIVGSEGANPDFSTVFAGAGSNPMAASYTFSTTAVPEPSSTALLGLSSVALLLRRRR